MVTPRREAVLGKNIFGKKIVSLYYNVKCLSY